MDGKIVVEDEAGELSDFTTVSWQIGLGETLCYRFRSESRGMSGTVEVTFLSLKSVYSIMDSYRSVFSPIIGRELHSVSGASNLMP